MTSVRYSATVDAIYGKPGSLGHRAEVQVTSSDLSRLRLRCPWPDGAPPAIGDRVVIAVHYGDEDREVVADTAARATSVLFTLASLPLLVALGLCLATPGIPVLPVACLTAIGFVAQAWVISFAQERQRAVARMAPDDGDRL